MPPAEENRYIERGANMHRLRFEREMEFLAGGSATGLLHERETPPVPASPYIPRGLKALEHFHERKSPIPSATPPAASLGRLTPEGMNPGFVNNSDELIVDGTSSGLDGRLKEIMTKYMPADYRDGTKVALVDLSGRKLFAPEYAGWKSTVLTVAASTAKVLPIYAAHQLVFDLNQIGKTISGQKEIIKTFNASLRKAGIVDGPVFNDANFRHNSSTNVFSIGDPLATHLRNIHASPGGANYAASRAIRAVGFGYLASVIAQSGLWHNQRKGLWLRGDYAGSAWTRSPVGGYAANCNALSLVTFFTLLAQGRLVSETASDKIKDVLRGGSWMGSSIKTAMPSKSVTSFTKVGLLNKCTAWTEKDGKKICKSSITTTRHEAGIIEIEGGKYRFAIAILTTGNTSRKTVVEALSKSLAELIIERNP